MKHRIKRDDLKAMITTINYKLNPSARLELNYASAYGGYCLSFKQDQGLRATPRMPIREMYRYLQGVLDYIQPD
jgi:hypothetical protein